MNVAIKYGKSNRSFTLLSGGGGSEGIIFYVTSESKEKRNFLSSRTRDNGLT